jgi:hypothetical protein
LVALCDGSAVIDLALIVACLLWMFYAYVHDSVELFLTNLIIGVIAIVIASLRLRYGGHQ